MRPGRFIERHPAEYNPKPWHWNVLPNILYKMAQTLQDWMESFLDYTFLGFAEYSSCISV